MEFGIYCIGINYKKVPLAVRETAAVTESERHSLWRSLSAESAVEGRVALSTCNRTELYFCGGKESVSKTEQALAQLKRISKETLLNQIYVYGGEQALRHLFVVCCGLDSMILGEDEILRQVRESYGAALREKTDCRMINIAFQGALHCAKCIKTETLLSKTAVSYGTLAANQIERFFGGKDGSVLIVGITGRMGQILAKNLYSKGIRKITGTSRKHKAAAFESFLREDIPIVDFSKRYDYLENADVVVSATASPHYTFTSEKVRASFRTKKRRLFLDLAVPRDLDTDIAALAGCLLFDIDDFKNMAETNNARKLKEADKAQEILKQKLEETKKNMCISEFAASESERFLCLKDKKFGSVFYLLKERLSGSQFQALVEAMETIEPN